MVPRKGNPAPLAGGNRASESNYAVGSDHSHSPNPNQAFRGPGGTDDLSKRVRS